MGILFIEYPFFYYLYIINKFIIIETMIQRFLRTTSDIFYPIEDKSIYNNSIVFIEDTKQIWTNGVYYASTHAKDIIYTSDDVDYNNVQDMLDYLLYLHKKDFDESFNMDFGYESKSLSLFDMTFDKTFK